VTLRIRRDVPSLRSRRLVRELERCFRVACERGRFRVVHYSVQRDHVHLIIEADDASALGRGMSSIGARIARAVNRVFSRRGKVLADRYHHRVLRTPREVRNALAYLLLNFLRKHAAQRGVRAPVMIDPASSGRWFLGWTRQHAPPPPERAPVAKARSWLLRAGWLRHGRIDPREVPGARR
jgi:REP element-mobilizing transposase RayT